MPYNALQFLGGVAHGVNTAHNRQKEYDRQAFLDELERKRTEAGIKEGADRTALGHQEMDLRSKQFDNEYGTVVPEGFSLNIGGKLLPLPGRADLLRQVVLPYEEHKMSEDAANNRLGRELSFRERHPEQYGGSQALTGDRARQQLLLDIFGGPQLGEQPGSRSNMFQEALGMGQKYLPNLYGTAPSDMTQDFISAFLQGKDRNSAKEAVMAFRANHPDKWSQMDFDKIDSYISHLEGTRHNRMFGPQLPPEDQFKRRDMIPYGD